MILLNHILRECSHASERDTLPELNNYCEVDNGYERNSSHLLIGRNNFN